MPRKKKVEPEVEEKKSVRPRRGQFLVDEIRSQMTDQQRQEFDDYCRYSPRMIDILQLLKEMGFYVSLSSIGKWYKSRYPTGREAALLNELGSHFDGLEISMVQKKLLGMSVNLLLKGMEKLEGENVSTLELFRAMPALFREARSLCSNLQEEGQKARETEIVEIVLLEAIAELKLTFESDAVVAEAIEQAGIGVRKRIVQKLLGDG